MYKNIICFLFFFITRTVLKGRVRESRRWLKCTHMEEMAEMHTQRGATEQFFYETSISPCFILPVDIIFRTPTYSTWPHLPRIDTPSVKHTPRNPLGKSAEEHQCPVYFRKQVYIQSCYPRNLCSMSKGSSCQYLTLRYEHSTPERRYLHFIKF